MLYDYEKVEYLNSLVEELYSRLKKYFEQTEYGSVPEIDTKLSEVWKRREVIYHLTYLNIVRAQLPEKRPDLYKDFLADENLQNDLTIYEKELNASLDEFNRQTILNAMCKLVKDPSLRYKMDRIKNVGKLQPKTILPHSEFLEYYEKFSKAWDENAYRALESRYYNNALGHFGKLGNLWQKLHSHPLGKFFVLKRDDILEIHKNVLPKQWRL